MFLKYHLLTIPLIFVCTACKFNNNQVENSLPQSVLDANLEVTDELKSETEYLLPQNIPFKPVTLNYKTDFQLPVSSQVIESEGLKILVFGDAGTGDTWQYKTAKAMQNFCQLNGCHMALYLGDIVYQSGLEPNFLPDGSSNPKGGLNDPQIKTKIEIPYLSLNIPFFPIFGEHDFSRMGKVFNWQALIEYSKIKPYFWHMPSDTYTINIGDIKIINLNTTLLDKANTANSAKEQTYWLNNELTNSTAKWNIVTGHKPIYSYGRHGNNPFMINDIQPILCKQTDFYLAGHEHDTQVLKGDCDMRLLITGSAGKMRLAGTRGPRTEFQMGGFNEYNKPDPAFSWLHIKQNEITLKVIDSDSQTRFQNTYSKKLPPKL